MQISQSNLLQHIAFIDEISVFKKPNCLTYSHIHNFSNVFSDVYKRQEYDERYQENNLDTILTDDPLNDSLIEEIKSIPGVTDVMTREIVSVNLNGTRLPADLVSKKDFDFMRQDGDIGSMDYDQAVKNGDIFFCWSACMEQDGYAPGESIVFDFERCV